MHRTEDLVADLDTELLDEAHVVGCERLNSVEVGPNGDVYSRGLKYFPVRKPKTGDLLVERPGAEVVLPNVMVSTLLQAAFPGLLPMTKYFLVESIPLTPSEPAPDV